MMKVKPKMGRKRRMKGLLHLYNCFRKKMIIDRIDVYSAQAAFYLIMSIIPMLMLMFTLLQFTPLTKDMIMDALAEILVPDIMTPVQEIVNNVYAGSFTLISFSAISLFWVAGKGIMGLANGLNNIYHLRENRNFVVLRLRSSIYTVLMTIALILVLGSLVIGLRFQKQLLTALPFLTRFNRLPVVLLVIGGLLAITLIFALLYVFLPNLKKKFRTQLPGAFFTTVSWGIFSVIFKIYLDYAENLSVIYGGLLTIVVAMMWLYFCMYLFFFGAEINAWLEDPDILPN